MKFEVNRLLLRAATMLLAMTAQTAWAQDPATIGSIQYNNTNNAYEINSVDNLNDLAVYVNGTGTYSTGGDAETTAHSCEGMLFVMSADIAYTGTNNFTPIGTEDKPFKGTFVGCGHKITGININDATLDYAGLFGLAEDATIDGVSVENASINANSYCGIFVGYAMGTTKITTITRCKAMGSVSGSHDVGGFAGVLASDDIIISECFAIGDATGRNTYYTQVGGFVGTIARSATISDSYSLVTAKGSQRVGGFVGYIYPGEPQVLRCYSAGVVDCSGAYAGAFVGYLKSDGEFTSCAALCNGIRAAGTNTAGTSETQDGVAELDAAGMKSIANFPDWLDSNDPAWTQFDGVTQPLLKWSVTNGLTVCASASGNGNGNVEVTADSYAPGAVVTINAVADNNSFFDGWTGTAAFDDPTKATTTIVLDNHHVVTAPFGKLISIPAELQAVNDDLSGIYALAIDIDLTGIDWTPIGNASTRFTGKFYGRGYKILNMSCTKDPAVQGRGLFGGTRGATLDGITVTGTVSATSYFTGGLVGTAEGTLITNCHANCDVYSGDYHTGGLVGAISESTVVTGCSAEGTVVTGDDRAGGLVGSCGTGAVAIRDCVSSSEVVSKKETYNSTKGEYVGGLIGYINSDRADISGCRADGYVSGNGSVGGFVGCINGSGTVNITDCVARGDVRSPGNRYGGFIGWANAANATIKDCWCSGAVWGKGGYMGAFVGDSMAGSFENCRVYTYGPGPRLFSGSQTTLTYDALTATQVANLSKDKDDTPWPAVKKHTHGLTPIATAAQLQAVNDNATSLNGCYVLVDDIDLTGIDWTPIGNATTGFTGEFYGQGHKISRYTVNTTNQYAGLFGNIAGGRVSGVLAEEGNVSRTGDTDKTVGVGGFAGQIASRSMVDDCSFMGTVSNAAAGKNGGYGGFVGCTNDSIAILRCCAEVESVDNDSQSQPNTGGFVGSHGGGYIVDAYANAPVYGYANSVGGFAGYVGSYARIANAWCKGQVGSQGAYCGAFVGQAHANALITNSYYDDYPNFGMLAQGTASAGGSILYTGITGLDDMDVQDNFQGFDFDATWMMDVNAGIPVFRRGTQHVTFDAAGGTCEMESHDYAIGHDYDYNEDLPVPDWTGYLFIGWFDDLGFQVTDDSSVTIDANRTLHARWKKLLANTDITVDAIPDQAWTGNAITPAVTVKDGTKNISSECEFAYTNNQNTGTATVTISAKATSTGYTDNTTTTFNIVPIVLVQSGAVKITQDQDGKYAVVDGNYAGTDEINLTECFSVGQVTYNRTFPIDTYCTIMLPFEAITNQLSGIDFIYTFSGVEKDHNDTWVATMTQVWDYSQPPFFLSANTPYIVKMQGTQLGISGDVTFKPSNETHDSEVGDWEFRGTKAYTVWDATHNYDALGRVYGFAATAVTDDDIEIGDFVRATAGAFIRPLRAYLYYGGTDPNWNKSSQAPRHAVAVDELPDRIPVRIIGNDATDIVEMRNEKLEVRNGNDEVRNDGAGWYTLDGRKLSQKPTAKGVYIVNGRKEVVK